MNGFIPLPSRLKTLIDSLFVPSSGFVLSPSLSSVLGATSLTHLTATSLIMKMYHLPTLLRIPIIISLQKVIPHPPLDPSSTDKALRDRELPLGRSAGIK